MRLSAEQDPREVIEDVLGQSLDGPLGNAWFILGAVRSYLKDSGLEKPAVDRLLKGAMDDDYDHLLTVCAEALLEV
jgi:hypothetical protein